MKHKVYTSQAPTRFPTALCWKNVCSTSKYCIFLTELIQNTQGNSSRPDIQYNTVQEQAQSLNEQEAHDGLRTYLAVIQTNSPFAGNQPVSAEEQNRRKGSEFTEVQKGITKSVNR